jgi:hypothetical protein
MFFLFRDARPPSERFLLQAVETARGKYWQFRKTG